MVRLKAAIRDGATTPWPSRGSGAPRPMLEKSVPSKTMSSVVMERMRGSLLSSSD